MYKRSEFIYAGYVNKTLCKYLIQTCGFYHPSMLTQYLDTVLPDVLNEILRSGHSKMQEWQEKLI